MRVVPDVTGIDKQFDYVVPPPLVPRARPGAVARVELNGRTVDAWVVAVGIAGSEGFDAVPTDRLLPVADFAGLGIAEGVTELCEWTARHWAGPLRNVLKSATPVRRRPRAANPRRGSAPRVDDAVSRAAATLVAQRRSAVIDVPPVASALPVVIEASRLGPVLVLCPTLRMARLGAAFLRRRGLTTAEMPDEVDAAIAGVDVVIGARSAVFAPCAGLSSIVVIDEHEEAYHEERVPTWWAPAVAVERAKRAGVPVWMTSPVPSAAAELLLGEAVRTVAGREGWPPVAVVDLADIPVSGSLLSAELLAAIREPGASVLCVLNAKGTARLLACRSCRTLQTCGACGAGAAETDGVLACPSCSATRPAICAGCGRTALVTLRAGTGRLRTEIESATGVPVTEVTASTEGTGDGHGVWVGTDALLHRVRSATSVVFLDADRDLLAPRSSAARDFLAQVARAARITGRNGRIIIQTRAPAHPAVRAVSEGDIAGFRAADAGLSRSLGLAPFVSVAACTVEGGTEDRDVPSTAGVQWSRDGNIIVARAAEHESLLTFVAGLRQSFGPRVRVAVNPPRL